MAASRYFIQEQSLQCSLCSESWVDKDHRVLPCQHTFCLQCLLEQNFAKNTFIAKTGIKCPDCEEFHELNKEMVRTSLPKNYFANSLNRALLDEKLCEKHEQLSTLFCISHNIENLCSICFDNDHSQCQVSTMNRQLKNKELIKSHLNIEENNQKELLSEIEQIEKDYLLKIQNDFKMIRQVSKKLRKQREDSLMNLSKDITKQKNLLEYLENFSKNKLQLTILKNPKVEYQLKEIDYQNYINNEFSLTLNILNNNTTDTDKGHITKILQINNNLKKVNLSNSRCGQDYWSTICRLLEKSSYRLKEVNFSDCDLTEKFCKPIEKLLDECCQIELFNISDNGLGTGIQNICNGLEKSSSTLKELNFSDCDLTEKLCKPIEKLLNECCQIELFNISDNRLGTGIQNICNGLEKSSSTLKELNFSDCDLTEKLCKPIEKLLNECCQIELFNISDNRLGTGIQNICNGLEKSSATLKELNFSNCDLKGENWDFFEIQMRKFCNLEVINLKNNKKIGNGFLSICSGFANSGTTLKEINLSNCNITKSYCSSLQILLSLCSSLEIIDLSLNSCMGKGLSDIINSLKRSSKTLREISLSKCNITEKRCKEIKDVLMKFDKLNIIDLSFNFQIGNGLFHIRSQLSNSVRII
ncbi:unnamed protein product [Dimorphilus gyrociliatus]|uniref:RING-type domain-containing protein n=1 Tax=Dimorphilus gyrociliatus TaxID=2664684 RepID=A0A7I8WEJ2_9ANNE|nr:unnamed protein product [Dimorphilus gyrociliatus]